MSWVMVHMVLFGGVRTIPVTVCTETLNHWLYQSFLGRCRQQDVAVKVLHKQTLTDEELAAFRREIEILSYVPENTNSLQNNKFF